MTSTRVGTAVLTVMLVACSRAEQRAPVEPGEPIFARARAAAKSASGASIQATMTGQLGGATQKLSGRHDASTIVAKGNYLLPIRRLNLSTLKCRAQLGSIPWEPGLVLFVQSKTPSSGVLDLNYAKPTGAAGRVDSWEAPIDGYSYKFQFFRWSSSNSVTNADGSTTVSFRDGSVEVFKKKGGRILSREQCFGAYLNYDLTVK